jgi:outer membrane protein assembly factor BamD (BamD/ComL family)
VIHTLIILILSANAGVVIVDNVWFYGDDHKMRILTTGDMVEIVEHINETVRVEYDSATGELNRNVLIDLNEEIAEDEQFVFARGYFDEGEYVKSARLLEIFTKYFDDSKYLSEALYYLGQSYEAMALKGQSDSFPGFSFNDKVEQAYYNGDVYRILINAFPDSPFAPKAEYRLINIFRLGNLPWQDSVELIQQELTMWDEFCSKYQNTDEYLLGLSEKGHLNRVLFEITNETNYKEEAIVIFTEITTKYPNTVHAAYANVHLFEIERGEKIYKY